MKIPKIILLTFFAFLMTVSAYAKTTVYDSFTEISGNSVSGNTHAPEIGPAWNVAGISNGINAQIWNNHYEVLNTSTDRRFVNITPATAVPPITYSAHIPAYTSGSAVTGIMFRWQDSNNFLYVIYAGNANTYTAYMELQQRIAGVDTQVGGAIYNFPGTYFAGTGTLTVVDDANGSITAYFNQGLPNSVNAYTPIFSQWTSQFFANTKCAPYTYDNTGNKMFYVDDFEVNDSTAPITGRQLYVSKTGNDGNDGTDPTNAHAWITVQHGAGLVQAGDTLNIRAGSYNEIVHPTNSGSCFNGQITFKSYPGETATLDGTGLVLTAGLFYTFGQSFITLQNITFTNCQVQSMTWGDAIKYMSTGNTNLWLLNDTVKGNSGNAAVMYYAANGRPLVNSLIYGCEVSGNTTASQEAIHCDGFNYYGQILNNYVHDNSNIGIDVIGWSTPPPAYWLIQGNTSVRNGSGTGYANQIYIDGGQFCTVQNNLCTGGDCGIAIDAENAGNTAIANIVRLNVMDFNKQVGFTYGVAWANGRVRDVSVYNNTLYANDASTGYEDILLGFYLPGSIGANTSSLRYFNNINVDTGAAGGYMIYGRDGVTVTASALAFDYNDFVGGATKYHVKTVDYSPFSQWQSTFSEDAHSVTVNPLFAPNAFSNNYGLSNPKNGTKSPLIGAGTFLTTTNNVGGGTTSVISVVDARPFTDGYGMFSGDIITVGGVVSQVLSVDYVNNSLTVYTPLAWGNGANVGLVANGGSSPFIGAFPAVAARAISGSSSWWPYFFGSPFRKR